MTRTSCRSLLVTFGLVAMVASLALARAEQAGVDARGQAPAAAGAAPAIDVFVTDKDGRTPDSLRPADLAITVDGKPRDVLWIRRVSRGPGAVSDATARAARGDAGMTIAAEPIRNVIVVVDQATLVQGDERAVVQASGALVDRLGIADRVAVLRLPFSAGQQVALTTERPAARESLARVRGLVPRSTASRVDDMLAQSERDRAGVLDANRAGDPEPARADPVAGAGMPVAMPESELTHARGSLAALLGVMNSLRSMPGRKAVAFLSAGVPRPDPSQVADVVAAAASAHAVIYTFELQGSPDDPRTTLDTAPLQALARNTGGLFVTLGRNADRTMDRTVTDLAACFTVGLQPAEGDGSAKPRTLRVSTSRKDVTVRSAAWLVAATEAEEVIPVPPVSISGAAPPDAPTVPAGAPPSRADARSPRDAELQVALGRVFDYVEAYEREYSVLVAEEEYRQNADRKSVRLRSDLLFVKPETSDTWISFRDVFEVDGTAVRDREDRLKRLFLEPGIEAGAQLTMIKDESARYNIGPFERNINVPQFPLKILNASNRDRFHFRLAGRTDTAGVQVWRIDFKETARPTLVTDLSDRDVPTAGWFTVEQGSGAIVETGLKFDEGAYTAVIVVQYRLDQNLGMWVPARMTEDYRILRQRGPGAFGAAYVTALDGTATYTKYRRFQVKTEETVTVPKKH